MSTKKNSVVSQALAEMDTIVSAIKEESKKSLKTMLNESVREALREGCCDEDDEYDVLDGEDNEKKDAENKDEKKSKKSAKSDVDEDGINAAAQPQMKKNQPAVGGTPDANAANGESFNEPGGEEAPEAPAAEGGNEEGFDEFSEYNVGDNAYDLSGEKDLNKAIKIYKLLNNDDRVVVKMDGDQIHLTDNEANTEYVIDTGADGDVDAAAVDDEGMTPKDGALNEGSEDIAGLPNDDEIDSASAEDDGFEPIPSDDEDYNYEDDIDAQVDDMYDAFGNRNVNDYNGMSMAAQSDDPNDAFMGQTYGTTGMDTTSNMMDKLNGLQSELDTLKSQSDGEELMENKFKKSRRPMKESKEVLFEVDLGYTDNYQDKDPIKGLSNNEPSKSGKSWHKGVPTGTEKPWAGDSKSKGAPFSKTQKVEGSVNEEFDSIDGMPDLGVDGLSQENAMEEATNVGGAVQQRTSSKSHIPAGREQYGPKTKRHVSAGADYKEQVAEMKAIKKENKELKEALMTLRKNLNEAYITNVNLGKITKLFLENATSQQEKIDIVNRFSNEAKTVEQSQVLYESISKQLKKTGKTININESSATAKGTKSLNEQTVYKSNDLMKTIDLMNRMSNC